MEKQPKGTLSNPIILSHLDSRQPKEKKEAWEEALINLPAINYNLYIGSGKSACDDCLGFEEAKYQLGSFIRTLLAQERKKVIEGIEKMKFPEKKGKDSVGEFSQFNTDPTKPEETMYQFLYNETIDEILKRLKK